MNRNQARRLAAFNAKKAAEKLEMKAYCKKIDRAFSRLSEGCSERVTRAVSHAVDRRKEAAEATERKNHRTWYKDVNPFGNKIHAVQKSRGKSTPLI
ncbi:antitermination protein [Salmonella enterica]|uniref:antitermination protein n=1 Tax=Salmonella enterica TaxID=28901 RepID=UPI00193DF5E8|nr:antitermination protein [Salmonella enterica]EIT8883685.1 antitermination protein [Salmonella enterica subsp. enterica serovar Tananarive]EHX6758957.1 antitermination protein [Salmonella enterica subsp. enterica serovar Brunei]EHZ0471799.1 antitermination protein [Salmonella enterica subsp. enterica serovar Brunei]EIT8933106.1 antitermination protein [Salmonella enterica subsp. enterica serovar Brunei]ELF8482822.1 antitermination protein [Salmonella enterica]